MHYTVSKTVDGRSGSVGPYTTKEAADAAANSERDSAVAAIQAEAQSAVNNAIASAQAQLASLQFRYDEVTIPYGFESYWGSNGSHQTITVPANSNNAYEMRNAEWSLQINIKKTDSETGSQIAGDARYEIYQWDIVTGKYQPTGGYNTYSVQRQGDGTYAVINNAAYATNDTMRHTLYYTQRNEGRFILVETKAPAGYFGDWTDIDHPGSAGTPLGKRAYYVEITADNNNSILWLGNGDYNADIATGDKGGTKLVTSGGVETTVTIYDSPKDASRSYTTDASGKAANEDSYTTTAENGIMKNDRTLGEISISKVDLDAQRYVTGDAAHGNAALDGAVYDLYAAEDITHPDGVTGVVDYSKIVDTNGNPLWHTTIRDNSGQWIGDYLPILKKDNLVASAKIEDGWLTFANLYLGKYYVVERSTGTVIPLREGALVVSGTYPTVDSRTKAATGQVAALAASNGHYTDWVYKNQFSTISKSKALDGTWTYDAYYLSYAPGYLCDEHNYYITPSYADEGWYVEKTTFANDTAAYNGNYHIHKDNGLAESQDQVAKGNVEISKVVSSSGQSNGLELEGAGFTFYLVSDLSKVEQFDQTRTGSYTLQLYPTYIQKKRTTSNRTEVRKKLNFCLERATNYAQFLQMAQELGISVCQRGKHMTYLLGGAGRAIRDTSLADTDKFTYTGLVERLEDNSAEQLFIRERIAKILPNVSTFADFAKLLQSAGVKIRVKKQTGQLMYKAVDLDGTWVPADALGDGFTLAGLESAIKNKSETLDTNRSTPIAELYQKLTTNYPQSCDTSVRLTSRQICSAGKRGVLLQIHDSSGNPAKLMIDNSHIHTTPDGSVSADIGAAFSYDITYDDGTHGTIRGTDLIRQIDEENLTQPLIVSLTADQIMAMSLRGVTVHLPQYHIERLFIPERYVQRNVEQGSCAISLYPGWQYSYVPIGSEKTRKSISGAELAQSLGGMVQVGTSESSLARRVANVERRAGIANAQVLGKLLGSMADNGLHSAADFDNQISAYQREEMKLRNEIAELRSKSKTYASTAHNLQVCHTYKSVWLEYASKPLAQKDTFYKQNEAALQTYCRAASQLDKMGISQLIEPEKIQRLVSETENRISDLIAELEKMQKTDKAIQEDKGKVKQIQDNKMELFSSQR